MKIKIGNVVKNIPKRFKEGVSLLKESQMETPLRVRLTPFERFLLAEATWREDSLTREYLDGFIPTHAARQVNRSRESRYVVYYKNDYKSLNALAIVPKSVFNKCPNELRRKEYMEW